MNTPICDFVNEYVQKDTLRLHMPGHKGVGFLGVENRDITEIKGADSLFEADSIIKESEQNAGLIFGADTFYSTEGSSLCIRAMLYLVSLYAKKKGESPLVLSARNVHKSFVSAVSLTDVDVEWLHLCDSNYLSCAVDADTLDKKLSYMNRKPTAVYVTSPDYLGNMLDVKALADICHKHGVLLLVDNAHGAYLKFLTTSQHPLDLGADMCCDSAHKTLPVLTGGAYLHISKNTDSFFAQKAKSALSLFASTSPSYLILQSLDYANRYMSESFKSELTDFVLVVDDLKDTLIRNGYTMLSDEALKITISTKYYGYTGYDFAQMLRDKNIECEFCDPDYVVLMLAVGLKKEGAEKLKCALLDIQKKSPIEKKPPKMSIPKKVMNITDAVFANSKVVSTKESIGQILSNVSVSCPPAVPILVCGERIDKSALELFEYYSIDTCEIVVV